MWQALGLFLAFHHSHSKNNGTLFVPGANPTENKLDKLFYNSFSCNCCPRWKRTQARCPPNWARSISWSQNALRECLPLCTGKSFSPSLCYLWNLMLEYEKQATIKDMVPHLWFLVTFKNGYVFQDMTTLSKYFSSSLSPFFFFFFSLSFSAALFCQTGKTQGNSGICTVSRIYSNLKKPQLKHHVHPSGHPAAFRIHYLAEEVTSPAYHKQGDEDKCYCSTLGSMNVQFLSLPCFSPFLALQV